LVQLRFGAGLRICGIPVLRDASCWDMTCLENILSPAPRFIDSEPAPRLIVEPPLPGPLAQGVAFIP
jgi:Family of unknown function (DUF6130)